MKIAQKYWKQFLTVLALILIIVFFTQRNGIIPVEVTKPEVRDLEISISSSGELVTDYEADLTFGISGTLRQVYVSEGDIVKKGQSLALINNTEEWHRYQDSLIAKEKAIAAADEIREQYGDDVTWGVGYYRLKQANKAIQQAEESIGIYQYQLSEKYLTAPFTGVVLKTNKHPGEKITITDTDPIVKLADLSSTYFQMELDEEDIGSVDLGDPVSITFDAYEEQEINGTVSSIKQYVKEDEAGNSVIEVQVNFAREEDLPLILGLSGEADIILETIERVLTLPLDAIRFEGEQAYVFTVEDGKAVRRDVTIGKESDEYIVVDSGVNEQDTVIVDSEEVISSGSDVKVQ